MKITDIRTLRTETEDFRFELNDSGELYRFYYFHSPAAILLDGKTVYTRPDAWVLFSPHSHLRISCKSAGIYDRLEFEGDPLPMLSPLHFSPDTVYYAHDTDGVLPILRQLEREWLRRDSVSDAVAEHLLPVIFLRLKRQDGDGQGISEETLTKLIRIRAEIHRKFAHNWQIGEMAEMLGASEPQFFRLYKQLFGVPPKADLIRERIEQAKQLLLRSDEPIPTIANAVGFLNEYNFIRTFKNDVGLPPAKYRASMRGDRAEDTVHE